MSDKDERDTRSRAIEEEQEIAEAMLEQAEERAETSDESDAESDFGAAAGGADFSLAREKVVWQKRKQLYSKESSAEFTTADVKAWFSRLFRRGNKSPG